MEASVEAEVADIAKARSAIHDGTPGKNSIVSHGDRAGLKGEFSFGELSGIMPDISIKRQGDGGVDFVVPLKFKVDVKTAVVPRDCLLQSVAKGFPADIYILARYDEKTNLTKLVGWAWKMELKAAAIRDFGHGENYCMHMRDLRPMSELEKRIIKWRFA